MVELAALEKRCGGNVTEGSNPSLSAKTKGDHLVAFCLAWGLKPRVLASQNNRGFGVVNGVKMCLHIFTNEQRSKLACDIPPSPPIN